MPLLPLTEVKVENDSIQTETKKGTAPGRPIPRQGIIYLATRYSEAQ